MIVLWIFFSKLYPFAQEFNQTSGATLPQLPDTLLDVKTYTTLSLGGFSAALVGDTYRLSPPLSWPDWLPASSPCTGAHALTTPGSPRKFRPSCAAASACLATDPLRLLVREAGAMGITIAVVANSLVKSAIAVCSRGWDFSKRGGIVLIGATAVGMGGLLVA